MAEPFFYVDGDREKTPVELADQAPGTKLVFVDARGLDHHFMVGKRVTNPPNKVKERFDKGNRNQLSEG